MFKLILGILIPFFGTCLGAFLVFFLKSKISTKLNKIMLGFAAGVMIASSVWSLIIPSIKQAESMGKLLFIPAVCGICFGVLFMLLLDNFCRQITFKAELKSDSFHKKKSLLFWAVTIHNIPEGMAVGVVLASAYFGHSNISLAAALAVSLGIAIQNIPEGAIVSLPLVSPEFSKRKAFFFGFLSGIVEPLFACATIFLTSIITPILPYLLAFAAGAMIYVSIDELIPESHADDNSKISTIFFIIGFLIMMILDIVLG